MKQPPSKTIIVGLHGPIGSGKDTIASGLRNTYPEKKILTFKFARALYDMAKQIDPAFAPQMTHAAKEDWLLGNEALGTRRNFLEKLGTEFGRNCIHPDFWVQTLAGDIDFASPVIAIVTDVRFPNEAKWIRENGLLVHLVPDWQAKGRNAVHLSNSGLPHDPMDIVLNLTDGKISEGVEALRRVVAAMEDSQ